MPIYEFYCEDCHTVFNFFARRIDTSTRPACPRCGRAQLERWLSVFAISKGRKETESPEDALLGQMDEEKMMQAFEAMGGELENIDAEDPRQAARMMRRLFETAGIGLNEPMREAMRRMEAGEDPETIEADMGDALDADEPLIDKTRKAVPTLEALKALRRDLLPPRRDETLYSL
jgi:putative FmdB family regulatory protein